MREKTENQRSKRKSPIRALAVCLLFSLSLSMASQPLSHAESLFRASTSYKAQAPFEPKSLFTPPIARQVGDMVTIQIQETAATSDKAELSVTRNRLTDNTGASPYNQLISWAFGKFGAGALANKLSGPTITDNGSNNSLSSTAQDKRTTTYTDSISCQVVQVLPNGDLVVQGQKTVQMNKERQDLMVTGIVKPFYLDRNNQISSTQVGNLQLIRGGKGIISRQQNDGMANKINQFFN